MLWMVQGQQIWTKSKYLEKNPSSFSPQVQVTSLLGQGQMTFANFYISSYGLAEVITF